MALNYMEPAFILLFVVQLWDLVWKGIALWKAGQNKQLYWFIALLVFNTIGILPIVYLLFFQKKSSIIVKKEIKKAPVRKKKKK